MPPKKTTETDVSAASRVQQVADLAVGDTVSITQRLDGDQSTKETIKMWRESLRNTAQAVARRATDRTGQKYIVEGGEITTRSLDLLVVIAITRTE